ncbi:MAG: hypothetical protein ACOYBX_06675 [Mycobacterium sp.]
MAIEGRTDPDQPAEHRADEETPVVYSCSRVGMQANPPGRRMTLGRRRRAA